MRASQLAILVLFFCAPLRAQSDCQELEKTPIGTANQKGYLFNYQSGRGNECRTYRLRNTQGKLLTPALWQDTQEIFLDVNLPECQISAKECPWTEAVKTSISEVIKGPTTLSYGINKDECQDDPDAYRRQPAEGKFPAFMTIIRGVVAEPNGKSHSVAVKVISSAKPVGGDKPYLLLYRMELLERSEPFRLLRPGVPSELQGLGLLWGAAATRQFLSQLDAKEITNLTPERNVLSIELRTRSVSLDESHPLAIFAGKNRIAATTAPAYIPKE